MSSLLGLKHLHKATHGNTKKKIEFMKNRLNLELTEGKLYYVYKSLFKMFKLADAGSENI